MKFPQFTTVLTILGFTQIQSFAPSSKLTNIVGRSQHGSNSNLQMVDPSKEDLTGKVVAQRYIYRFSPDKSAVTTPYTLEERQYYTVAEDRSLEPFGGKCFIFRDGEVKDDVLPPEESLRKNGTPRVHKRIGKALYTVKDLCEESEEEGEDLLGGSIWDSSYVLALYCMEHPEIIRGKGIEVGSGMGWGGILSTIGAGVASGSTESAPSEGFQSIEDIAATPVEDNDSIKENLMAPVPKNLTKIILTDSKELLLNQCLDNLGSAKFPISKAEVGSLDWNRRVPNDSKNQFDFIIGCECAYYFPLVSPLARTVAYSLKSSPYDRTNNEQIIRGHFLHIGPQHRESIDDLKRKLGRGYRMNTRMKEIVMERIDLVPLFIDSVDDIESQMKEEVEGETAGYVEYQNIETSKYFALIGYHNEDYDGFNGDYFFPAETGKEGSFGDSAQELDYGTEAM